MFDFKTVSFTKSWDGLILLFLRGCTDIICCLLFTVFLGGWMVVAVIGEDISLEGQENGM